MMKAMGKIHAGENWLIRVRGNEHPPIHVHVFHPDGEALVYLDGVTLNRGVPTAVLAQAQVWVATHAELICAEWARMNNPAPRGES
jgi:hypothetical protein